VTKDDQTKAPALLWPSVVLLLLVSGTLLVLRPERAPTETVAVLETEEPRSALASLPAPSLAPAFDRAAGGVLVEPRDPSLPVPEGARHPHPITPEHERIFEENRLFAAISDAMDRRDTAGMRRMLEEYEDAYPEDSHLLRGGFAVIADCIDHPGEASTAAARAYDGANKASILRRYVRRHCFEQSAR
jgi:hypothetical protein